MIPFHNVTTVFLCKANPRSRVALNRGFESSSNYTVPPTVLLFTIVRSTSAVLNTPHWFTEWHETIKYVHVLLQVLQRGVRATVQFSLNGKWKILHVMAHLMYIVIQILFGPSLSMNVCTNSNGLTRSDTSVFLWWPHVFLCCSFYPTHCPFLLHNSGLLTLLLSVGIVACY